MSSRCARTLAICGQIVLASTVSVSVAYAQSGAATGLSGRVTDTTGASMAGVTVTVVRLEAGFERTTTTNAGGDWEARFLAPGVYRISFELRGFKTLQREGVA